MPSSTWPNTSRITTLGSSLGVCGRAYPPRLRCIVCEPKQQHTDASPPDINSSRPPRLHWAPWHSHPAHHIRKSSTTLNTVAKKRLVSRTSQLQSLSWPGLCFAQNFTGIICLWRSTSAAAWETGTETIPQLVDDGQTKTNRIRLAARIRVPSPSLGLRSRPRSSKQRNWKHADAPLLSNRQVCDAHVCHFRIGMSGARSLFWRSAQVSIKLISFLHTRHRIAVRCVEKQAPSATRQASNRGLTCARRTHR